MTLTVYYTEFSNLFTYEPELVLKNLNGYVKRSLLPCPAFAEALKNTYLIRSVVNYELNLENNRISSPLRDQKFFDTWVSIRDTTEGACSFYAPQIVFFAEESLKLELKPANYHYNGFTNNATIIEGCYDIGRHFRPLEAPFTFRQTKKVTMSRGDPLYYVKFCTEEKIKLVPFHYTPEIASLVDKKFLFRGGKPKPLSYWYDIHEKFYKKRLLKLIKESLL